MERHPPVKTIAAEIQKLAAAVAIILQRIQRLGRVVFGVAASGQCLVPLDRLDPVIVEFLIGDDIIGKTLIVQPGPEMTIRLKMPMT